MTRSMRTSGRGYARTATVLCIAAAVALAFVAAPTAGSEKDNGLKLSVVATTKGPLSNSCSGTDCNIVFHFLYVTNKNRLTGGPVASPRTRATVPNAFVVDNVEVTLFVDGVQQGGSGTFYPPPNAVPSGFSGRWPSTVVCGAGSPPCNEVLRPAVDPGETTAVLIPGWVNQPEGENVFQYTVHGTLNGIPVDLTATSPAITFTS